MRSSELWKRTQLLGICDCKHGVGVLRGDVYCKLVLVAYVIVLLVARVSLQRSLSS